MAKRLSACSLFACLWFVVQPAGADTFERLPNPLPGSQLFDDPSLWTNLSAGGNGVPGKSDTALFSAEPDFPSVYLRSDQFNERLLVSGGGWVLESETVGPRTYHITTDGDLPDADVDVSGGSLAIGIGRGPLHIDAPEGILFIGESGDGAISLFQAGAHLEMGGVSRTHVIGDNGHDGSLTLGASAKATIGIDGTLDIASSNSDFTTASVDVSGGALLNTGSLSVANRNSGATATVYVGGGGARVVQSAGAAMNLGSLIGGEGELTIDAGGEFNSGGGAQNINGTGRLNMTGGVYNANGTIKLALTGVLSVQGGQINARAGLNNVSGGIIDLQSGRLAVTDGAFTPKNGQAFVYDPGSTAAEFVIGSGGSANFDDGVSLQSGRFLLVDGASVQSTGSMFTGDTLLTKFTGGEVILQDATTNWSVDGDFSLRSNDSLSTASLVIESGAVLDVSRNGTLGREQFAAIVTHVPRAEMLVTGPSSRFNARRLDVGRRARATLRITAGGSVVVAGGQIGLVQTGNGLIEVSGTDSMLEADGSSAFLTSSVTGEELGLRVNSGGQARFSNLSLSVFAPIINSEQVVIDNGELIVTGVLDVGGSTNSTTASVGNGQVSVRGGGRVQTTTAHIAPTAGSVGEADLSGAGSLWRNTGDLVIGGTATEGGGEGIVKLSDAATLQVDGVLNVRDNGVVRLAGGTLRFDSTALANTGSIELESGILSLLNPGGYAVGAANGPFEQLVGSEHIVLPEGIGLSIDQTLFIPAGSLVSMVDGSLSGGTIKNQGLVTAFESSVSSQSGITNDGDLVLIDSTVDGPLTSDGDAAITVLGLVRFNGAVSGSGGFFGPGVAQFNGGFSPGSSPAEVAFEGDLALGTGNTLLIELGGPAPGSEYDRLAIEGTAMLDGALELSLLGGFVPTLGDSFEIIDSEGGVIGQFSSESAPDLGPLMALQLLYESDRVLATIVPALDGDFNIDGRVDAADYTVWRDGLGTTFTVADHEVWRDNFGATGTAPGSNAVPEPSAFLLALLACVACSRMQPRAERTP